MSSDRPNPDALLAQVRAAENAARQGSLRIFFGYAAGVGKTYSMLEAARRAAATGREVVVGYVEPHARPETAALLAGLEALPVKEISYRGITLREFDVDAALARRPEVLLVDELAHTNAEGCRHEKRWQDIADLRLAGIDVWTTLNVQHLESLNDVIGQITGITVRETVPDRVFDSADELELVDLAPEDLLSRLEAGKVYVPEQATRAKSQFFQKGNLAALRELSLRQAARRVHTDVESARLGSAADRTWATNERLLVCVGPSPTTARVIRTAKRMAVAFDAPWLAVAIDLTGSSGDNAAQQRIAHHFRLAERLGAETVTLAGQDVSATVLDFARQRNVTKILIGKSNQPRWRRLLQGTVVDDLLDDSGDIDVYVIHGEEEAGPKETAARGGGQRRVTLPYLYSAGWVAVAAMLDYGLRWSGFADSEANTAMMFLAAVAWCAYRHGRGPAVAASILSVLLFDFFFVPPHLTFAVSDAQYVLTFAVMLAIGLVISTLTSRLRAQVENTRQREHRTAGLYELGKQLSAMYGRDFLAAAAANQVREIVRGEVAVYLRRPDDSLELVVGETTSIASHQVSLPAAKWVADHEQLAGAGTNTLPNATALFLPLVGSQRTHGTLAVRAADGGRLLEPDMRRHLEGCANLLALALERDQMAIDAANARVRAESEQVRSSLLSGVSHDLRTPLAAIAGASSSLLEADSLSPATRRELLQTVADEADRLNRLLENLLQMSRLDAGAAIPHQQWHVLEEIVGSALHRTRRELARHQVQVDLPADLPLLFVDGLLLEQVFVNLLENVAKHTPPGTHVRIAASLENNMVRIVVADNGPGLPAGAEERVFEKFYRATPTDSARGSGLGLAICRAILRSHGGEIRARGDRGAEFVLQLPVHPGSPDIQLE